MTQKNTTVRFTATELNETLRRGEDRTDWARVGALSEEDLIDSIDHEEEGEPDWATVSVTLPRPKQLLTMRYDPEILEWFKAQGPGYQSKINAVLKRYFQAHSK